MVVYIFCHQMQNSAGTILQFELYPPLFTYNDEFFQKQREHSGVVSVYACCAIVPWFCSHHFLGHSL